MGNSLRRLGIIIGGMTTGRHNAITDVAGVRAGHTSIIHDGPEGAPGGRGTARTGATIILPHSGDLFLEKVRTAVHTINGYGKPHGFEQVRELGVIESPIALTNTLNVGLVSDSLVRYMIESNPEFGINGDFLSLNVIVGETNDGYLNDMTARFVRYEHVKAAIDAAKASGDYAPVEEGAVGAGTGVQTFGWKSGIGTASRVLSENFGGYSLGALVQSNFGVPSQLVIDGIPVGKHIIPSDIAENSEKGSIMIILATDAPLSERQLERIAKRASVGLARTGSHIGGQSGDFVIAFTTSNKVKHKPDSRCTSEEFLADENNVLPELFQAVIESVEEAVLNSLFSAKTMKGRNGHIRKALPADRVLEIMREYRYPCFAPLQIKQGS